MPLLPSRNLWQIDRLEPKRYRWFLGRALSRLVGAVLMGVLLGVHLAWPEAIWRIVGAILASLLAGLLLRFHLKQVSLRTATPRVAERLIWTTALVGVFGVQIVNLLTKSSTGPETFLVMAPLVSQAMLGSALLGPGVGIVGITLTVVLLGLFGAVAPPVLAACWLGGAVGCHTVNGLKRRSDLFRALSIQIGVQVLIVSVTAPVVQFSFLQAVQAIGWAGLAGVMALSIFWFGVAVFEKIFGIVSDWSLLELCSPESPLMHELNLKAPGTYAHSVGVGNLAENAAKEIGANAVLCRAMAYYHDIGKLARPSYFVENQMGENVHDDMPPSLSAKVIAAHVKDGVEMAHEARLPRAVVDGIKEHHGTSLISYFYHRAVKEGAESGQELEEKFRYGGPKPQSRETAILHLADMIEAASRTVRSRERLEQTVRGLIENSRQDGQLDECDLTFQDLRTVTDSFIHTLGALRHDRVAYPGQERGPDGKAAQDSDSERIARAIEA